MCIIYVHETVAKGSDTLLHFDTLSAVNVTGVALGFSDLALTPASTYLLGLRNSEDE